MRTLQFFELCFVDCTLRNEYACTILTLVDCLVSNGSLSNAAINSGLSPYILTKSFTGKKWRPIYVSTVLDEHSDGRRREMSTKTLADVVESLIGAAFQDGGFTKAIRCLEIFLPNVDWRIATEAHEILMKAYERPVRTTCPKEHLFSTLITC